MLCPKPNKSLNYVHREKNYLRSLDIELTEREDNTEDESTRSVLRRKREHLTRLIKRHERDPHGLWRTARSPK